MPGLPSRRHVLAAGLAVPISGALAACGGARAPGGRTRITFWSALRGSEQVVAAFNRSQRRIEVVFEQIPTGSQGGYAKLSNAARAGNAPDVATIEYPQLPGFAIDGVARDLTALIGDRLRRRLLPQALRRTTFDDRVFAVPLDIEPMVMHYRRDLFEQHGFPVPRTWAEFAELGRTVRDRLPERRITLFPTDGGSQFAAHACQIGARWFDIRDGRWQVSLTDAPTRRLADYWQRLINEDVVFTGAADSQQYNALIGDGLVLTRHSGAWDAGAQIKKQPGQAGAWGVAPMPRWDPDQPDLGDHGGSTFAITAGSERPEAAMEFIEWQVSHPDALRARLSAGTSVQYPAVPDLIDVGRRALDASYYAGQDVYGLFDQEAARIRGDWVWGPRMSSTLQVMQDHFARAAAGRGSLVDAVRAAQDGTIPDLEALGLAISEHAG
ncbi:ABC transporter substrate-binding protein [Saccharopolyspora gloriosae]|uniref:ABC transporter substrate-binding protein n=1 Tax=Saccharopolyspora gloriosae TaxID=455344 RepID=UPI001FB7A408|nr:extracellular solute-binding protein [Saccharopolyspora gloriosae]